MQGKRLCVSAKGSLSGVDNSEDGEALREADWASTTPVEAEEPAGPHVAVMGPDARPLYRALCLKLGAAPVDDVHEDSVRGASVPGALHRLHPQRRDVHSVNLASLRHLLDLRLRGARRGGDDVRLGNLRGGVRDPLAPLPVGRHEEHPGRVDVEAAADEALGDPDHS